MAALDSMDIAVITIGASVGLFAVVVTIIIIYLGYCSRCTKCCRKKVQPGRRRSDHGDLTAMYRSSPRMSLVPLSMADLMAQTTPDRMDDLERQGILVPADIDSRPPAPIIDPMEASEEDHALDMGLVFFPGQALKDLPGGRYHFPDEEDEKAPPLSPRSEADGKWDVVRNNLLRPKQIVTEERVQTGAEADHGENHYMPVRCGYRHLAPKRVNVQEEIGAGEFGTVHKGTWTKENGDQLDVAIKLSKDAGVAAIGLKKMKAEAQIMAAFNHGNLVKLHGVVSYDDKVMLVLELLSEGALGNYLMQLRPESAEAAEPHLPSTLLQLSKDVSSGLHYLSEQNFIHRDLAARNVFITSFGTAKIGDFGMSRLLADSDYYSSQGGKLPYKWCPPEVIHYQKFSLASDVWSFGILLHEIWSFARKPYFPMDRASILREVNEGHRMHPPPGCPRKIYTLMVDCWHPDRRKRPTAETLHEALSAKAESVLELDSGARRRLTELPDSAYQLAASYEASTDLYQELSSRYSHVSHDVMGAWD